MNLEFVGGKLDGQTRDVGKEDMEDTKVMTITYSTDDEVYIARKFHGEWVFFYFGKKDNGTTRRR